ncbi:hypothetical protein [Denitratimonas sp. CY0512]|uniref:DUF6923 family protein n=1 Tax=Denitratimonas sp. CY0512 TaxID=3131940 RepID=UPI0030982E1A|nr:hypothetical protein [Xanthomonadaceae bacterium XH05]
MTRFAISFVLLHLASFTHAGMLDCGGLANSADSAPDGYAEQCLNAAEPPAHAAATRALGAPGNIAYTLDMRGQAPRPANTLYSFTLSDFSTQTPIGQTQQPSLFALDFSADATTLYGISGSAADINPSTLFTIDPTTGAATIVAGLSGLAAGDSATGLSIDPITDVAYFSAAGGSPATSRLYTLDLTTGALTLIGQMTAPTDATGTLFIDIAISCQGRMYGHNISDDALYSIDVATGAGTQIGVHGLAANFAQGMDFDHTDDTLYAFIYTGSGTNQFGTFDLDTGAFTPLVQNNPLGEFEGAIPSHCLSDDVFADGFESPL